MVITYADLPVEEFKHGGMPVKEKSMAGKKKDIVVEKDLLQSELHSTATPEVKKNSHYISTPTEDSIYIDISPDDEEEVDYDTVVQDVNRMTIPAMKEGVAYVNTAKEKSTYADISTEEESRVPEAHEESHCTSEQVSAKAAEEMEAYIEMKTAGGHPAAADEENELDYVVVNQGRSVESSYAAIPEILQ